VFFLSTHRCTLNEPEFYLVIWCANKLN
jgi:hypothetical protein